MAIVFQRDDRRSVLMSQTEMSQVSALSLSAEVVHALKDRGITLVRLIATGGMSEVYEGMREGRRVAVKLLSATSQTSRNLAQALVHEAELMQRLHHPSLVEVLDAGQLSADAYFIAMPYAAGGTLRQRLADLKARGKVMRERDALQIAHRVASALEHIHTQGIIHRDVKPSNMLFMTARSAVKLADFGVAAEVEEVLVRAGASGASIVLGTPEYAAPEQAQGRADVRSDLYSLGIVLYEMLAGMPPFCGKSPGEISELHANAPLPPLTRWVSPETRYVIARATTKNPLHRFQSARDMREAIERAIAVLPLRWLSHRLGRAMCRFVLPALAALGVMVIALAAAFGVLTAIWASRLEAYLGAEQTWTLPPVGLEHRLAPSEAQRIASRAVEQATRGWVTVSEVVFGPTNNRVELRLRALSSGPGPVSLVLWLTASEDIPSIAIASIGPLRPPVISDTIEGAVNRGVLTAWQRLGRRLRSLVITPEGEMLYVLR